MKRWKKVLYASGNQNKVGTDKLIAEKIDFKPKMVIRSKESQNVMIKRST